MRRQCIYTGMLSTTTYEPKLKVKALQALFCVCQWGAFFASRKHFYFTLYITDVVSCFSSGQSRLHQGDAALSSRWSCNAQGKPFVFSLSAHTSTRPLFSSVHSRLQSLCPRCSPLPSSKPGPLARRQLRQSPPLENRNVVGHWLTLGLEEQALFGQLLQESKGDVGDVSCTVGWCDCRGHLSPRASRLWKSDCCTSWVDYRCSPFLVGESREKGALVLWRHGRVHYEVFQLDVTHASLRPSFGRNRKFYY